MVFCACEISVISFLMTPTYLVAWSKRRIGKKEKPVLGRGGGISNDNNNMAACAEA